MKFVTSGVRQIGLNILRSNNFHLLAPLFSRALSDFAHILPMAIPVAAHFLLKTKSYFWRTSSHSNEYTTARTSTNPSPTSLLPPTPAQKIRTLIEAGLNSTSFLGSGSAGLGAGLGSSFLGSAFLGSGFFGAMLVCWWAALERERRRQTDREERGGCCRINHQHAQVFIPVQSLEVTHCVTLRPVTCQSLQ